MASAGSALAPAALRLGRAGGELFLLKRVNRKALRAKRARFERQEFLAMMIPSMLPSDAVEAFVFPRASSRCGGALHAGGLLRADDPLLILSLLVLKLGPGAVGMVRTTRWLWSGCRRPGCGWLRLVVDAEETQRNLLKAEVRTGSAVILAVKFSASVTFVPGANSAFKLDETRPPWRNWRDR